jgi:FAD/FMN-containing dehydrogenase
MRRRDFCASAVAAVAAASIPWRRARASADTPALGPGERQIVLKANEIDELRAAMRGEVLLPGQDGYDAARRVWNGAFDRKPALIARCAGAADVIQAVNFGRNQGLLIAVRGGGHSLSGQSVCEGGLMIDLTPMHSVHVDPVSQVARVEPGTLLGSFDREAQAFGLVTTAGTVSHTGVAGLTLGGGFGRLGRVYGLSCDNLRAADVVTAAGHLVKTSESENPDLLWGLRGGGGNFGVVTSFEYRLHKFGPDVYAGQLVYPYDKARDLLNFYGEFIATAPDALYMDGSIVPTPDGQRAVVLDVCYAGSKEAAEKALAPARKFAKPLVDGLRPMTYVEIQRSSDDAFPHGRGYYIKSGFVKGITPAMVDAFLGEVAKAKSPRTVAFFACCGGAIARVKPDATAFLHRKASHSLALVGFWDKPEDRDEAMQWARESWKSLEPMTEGFYVNEASGDDPERRIRQNYGANYDRLVELKNRYDRQNLFRMNANVKPSA